MRDLFLSAVESFWSRGDKTPGGVQEGRGCHFPLTFSQEEAEQAVQFYTCIFDCILYIECPPLAQS